MGGAIGNDLWLVSQEERDPHRSIANFSCNVIDAVVAKTARRHRKANRCNWPTATVQNRCADTTSIFLVLAVIKRVASTFRLCKIAAQRGD